MDSSSVVADIKSPLLKPNQVMTRSAVKLEKATSAKSAKIEARLGTPYSQAGSGLTNLGQLADLFESRLKELEKRMEAAGHRQSQEILEKFEEKQRAERTKFEESLKTTLKAELASFSGAAMKPLIKPLTAAPGGSLVDVDKAKPDALR